MDIAAIDGNIDMVTWLDLNRSEGCSPVASSEGCTTAAMALRMDTSAWFAGCTKTVMKASHERCTRCRRSYLARYVRLAAYLHDNGCEACSAEAILAKESRNEDVEEILLKHKDCRIAYEAAVALGQTQENEPSVKRLRVEKESSSLTSEPCRGIAGT
ncbi:hypothetical protein GQ600_24211 [Phytophthora cactorum]|nr:hypothetical protein GQ600_24211 [Phytophthora cactorum]